MCYNCYRIGEYMENRNEILNITMYVISLIVYLLFLYLIYNLLFSLPLFYLFITIPSFFLFVILILNNLIKMILTLVKVIFGKKDNTEVRDFVYGGIKYVNKVSEYSLFGIFITMLLSLMTLDIYICVFEEAYVLLSVSIVIWILMYYFLFKGIIERIKMRVRTE